MKINKFNNLIFIILILALPIQQAHAFWWTLLKYGSTGTAGVVAGTAIANAANREKSACVSIGEATGEILKIRLLGIPEKIALREIEKTTDNITFNQFIKPMIHETYKVPLSELNVSIDSSDYQKDNVIKKITILVTAKCNEGILAKNSNTLNKTGNYYVTANRLNVRSYPSMYGDVTKKVYKGQKVIVYKIQDKWASISQDNENWVFTKYLSKEKIPSLDNKGVESCIKRGIVYFKEIGSYPTLLSAPNTGRSAKTVARERCNRTTTAFGD